ncbi:hypothetical protein [Sphingopyxis indica]|uniref:hypothetical protein n=1 Tax=Sphingopyxis indica TaxID=436663 RepID=UPI002938DEE2|nr:hypothetical protein [Sphingopyxis indica]
MMRKFDMAAAWDDARQLMRSYTALTVAIAAVFLFLPALAFAWLGPAPVAPTEGMGIDQIVRIYEQNMVQSLVPRIGVALAALIGTAAILRLWLARGGVSVGESLAFALALFPTLIAIELLTSLAFALGLLLLIVPGLYLVGRLAVTVPAAIDRGIRNPIDAIRTSWRLTDDNGWSIFFFLLLVTLVIGIISVIAGVVTMSLFGAEAGAGKIVSGLVGAAFIAAGSFVSLAVSAAIYRQLAAEGTAGVFE